MLSSINLNPLIQREVYSYIKLHRNFKIFSAKNVFEIGK